MDAVEELLTKIVCAGRQNKRVIIGVDGLSRSGKTTFVRKFASILSEKQIENMVFHLDDHIVGRSKRYNSGHEEWQEYYFLQWDVEWLKKSLLDNLIHQNEIELPFYDNKLDQHVYQKLQLTGKDVFIVEGIFLQREEWRPYFDFTVFIDCPRDIRFARERFQTQQNIEKFRNRYWKAEDYYMEKLRPVEKADLVIPYYELIN
ncbi:kinase [Mesobacillus selenatarsenatis]|uniref:Uridine kinase n=1 Tax=Mesobacillus selenatarsenatis (strain DSM 18680 / JCM 14380 / FERM P-15431 / SF-1) TaxID=1321606 RepID=A0A0A8X9U4_MESS1|nr:kinase [Mesobacillus selenatarsenatis]GAM14886.1 uridine kinase [Mesobacillus selenatarsenatis SF-1]